MEENIYDIINRLDVLRDRVWQLGVVPDYFKEDILSSTRKLVREIENIETETTY